MKNEDIQIVAKMVALDYNKNYEKGYTEALEHASDHLNDVPDYCYVAQKNGQIVGTMILHPQKGVFEIEDFHITKFQENKEAYYLLKDKLREYVKELTADISCCPCAFRRLIEHS